MAGPTHDRRCSAVSAGHGEPLAGTAFVDSRLLCVEHLGPWPRSVDRHPDPALAALAERARAAGRRLLLIRRPGRRPVPDSERTVLLADTAPGAVRVGALRVRGPEELADVPLDDAGAGAPVDAPMLLVCTHGTRDLCCAVEGRALAGAVLAAEPEDRPGRRGPAGLWECSHLGGHRFAPTALVLPTGYLYGRLDAASAVAARKAAGKGEVETALCRGRIALEPAGQVAELRIREAEGLRDTDALEIGPAVPVPGRASPAAPGVTSGEGPLDVPVRASDGRRWLVRVVPSVGAARPLSCGAGLARVSPLVATAVRVLA
ncbi:MAG: sucrase ferredoxin [Pseudonocardia sp.]|nr:sucrase ferredoxin [Pseudonocardia sp.]